MARMFLIPLLLALGWWAFLLYFRIPLKQGAKGFYWIIGIGGGVTTKAFVFTSLLTIPAFSSMGLYAVAVLAALPLGAQERGVNGPTDPPGTFSILGFDPETGEIGAAVQSRVFSVGNGVLWALYLYSKHLPQSWKSFGGT